MGKTEMDSWWSSGNEANGLVRYTIPFLAILIVDTLNYCEVFKKVNLFGEFVDEFATY
ncbi:hypothetical protein J1N09_11225 [Aureitalea sp. L0-47]|uniref:hypothetical protein n=1 Tax=Aureitalea sp. L0-47 TaxID=2816962 RepID=UPI002AA2B4ED|nr:hypothetical protein [Aureitalea sp. L0-47]MCW5520415.1 hypothetical protein [Aureitalea sp. L0-47]